MASKTILLPTDFSIDSLNLLIKALEIAPSANVNIIFVYGVDLPHSITELIFFSESKLLNTLYTNDFDDALKIIENKYASKINSIKFKLFSGVNKAAFANFIEASKLDSAYLSKNYTIKLPHSRSFDITPYIKKSSLEVIEVDCTPVINGFEGGHFSVN